MKTNLNTWLQKTAVIQQRKYLSDADYQYQDVRNHLKCKDGTTMSVQASKHHYCKPSVDQNKLDGRLYTHVEVWCVSDKVPESWLEYGGSENPYAFIPIEMVEEFIDSHGGIAE